MGKFAKQQKNLLKHMIQETSSHPELYTEHPGRDFTRRRILTFENTIGLLMSMGGNSLNKELFDQFKGTGVSVTVPAFIQQRSKIKPEALENVFHQFNSCYWGKKNFHGYRLLAVDGTVMTYNGSADQDTYMPNTGNGVNQYHVNALYDLLNRTYVDALIQPNPQANETMAAWQMMERTSMHIKSILIGDRGYGSINLIEHINRIEDAEYLFRIKNGLWKEIRDWPMKDIDTDIEIHLRTTQKNADKKEYAAGTTKWVPGHGKFRKLKHAVWDFESPYTVKVRVVRFRISEKDDDSSWETIVTSLPRDPFSPAVLKQMYHLRWNVETSFRELKYAIGVTNFHAKKTQLVQQEIWARLTMYNFCERIAMNVVINQQKHKWTYQVNYTMAIHICMEYYRERKRKGCIDAEKDIARYIAPIRPNRADRRKVRRKTAVFFVYRVA